MIWTISSLLLLNHWKNLEEPVWKKCGLASSELLKDVELMDIGLKRRTVSTVIPTIKMYPLICCYTFQMS